MRDSLIYTEMLGLRETNVWIFNTAAEGAIVYGRIDDRVAKDWYQRVRVPARNGQHRGLDWKRISVENLPKRLKLEALLLDIQL